MLRRPVNLYTAAVDQCRERYVSRVYWSTTKDADLPRLGRRCPKGAELLRDYQAMDGGLWLLHHGRVDYCELPQEPIH